MWMFLLLVGKIPAIGWQGPPRCLHFAGYLSVAVSVYSLVELLVGLLRVPRIFLSPLYTLLGKCLFKCIFVLYVLSMITCIQYISFAVIIITAMGYVTITSRTLWYAMETSFLSKLLEFIASAHLRI